MSHADIPLSKTALLTVDLQNDFIHPDGAYGRAGQGAPEIATLPARIKPLADLLRQKGGWFVSTQFTLVPAKGGEPLISPHLKELRPFLKKGDFLPGAGATASWTNCNRPISPSRRSPIPPST
jgi:ureidoacrylate peracid hydrolase